MDGAQWAEALATPGRSGAARLWSNCGGMRERLTAVIPESADNEVIDADLARESAGRCDSSSEEPS